MNACRICRCTDEDCTWCWVVSGHACTWKEPDLCSVCFIQDSLLDSQRALLIGDAFSEMARFRWGRLPGARALARRAAFMSRVCTRLDRLERAKEATPASTPNSVYITS